MGCSRGSSERRDRGARAFGNALDRSWQTKTIPSNDQSRIAVTVADPETKALDIWVLDIERETSIRLTFDSAGVFNERWSTDDRKIYFTSMRSGAGHIYAKASSGTGTVELIYSSEQLDLLWDLSPDDPTGWLMALGLHACFRNPCSSARSNQILRRLGQLFAAINAANSWLPKGVPGTMTARNAAKMKFIHDRPDWPKFSWDSDVLAAPLAAARHKQGKHLGRMEALGFDLRAEANLSVWTSEVVNSSAIEGETLSTEEVRSSIARRLGIDVAGLPEPGREVEGVVEMTLDATQNFDVPLTKDRLFGWHASLFPTGRSGMSRITVGAWRPREAGAMQVVSGPIGREKIHFEAPAADRLEFEMATFLEWANSPPAIDPVLRAGMAHFWFVTIHPFEDGNGRIARAIGDMALSQADSTSDRFYSLSSQIEEERKEYYLQLEAAQRGDLDITRWLTWFLGCLDRAIGNAEDTLAAVLYKAKLWQQINLFPTNRRQRDVINRMLDGFEGFLTTSKYAKLAKCSQDTALRDIRDLLDRGILVQNPGRGRSTSYQLAEPSRRA